MVKRKIYYFLAILLAGAFLYPSFKTLDHYLLIRKRQIKSKRIKTTWHILEYRIRQRMADFGEETGVVIKDLDTGCQTQINQDRMFPSASLVKIPVMASCFYAAGEGGVKLKEVLVLKAEDKVAGPGPLKDFPAGAQINIENLLKLMIAESDNTATNLLIERLSFDYLNKCFKRLGLKDTNISRKMMDFEARKQGIENYTTAQDMAYLLERVYRNELLSQDTSRICLELLRHQKIRDRIPARLPPDIKVAHKTGLERGICHDVGIVFTDKGDFLICVLVKHGMNNSNKAKHFIADLAFLTYNYYLGL